LLKAYFYDFLFCTFYLVKHIVALMFISNTFAANNYIFFGYAHHYVGVVNGVVVLVGGVKRNRPIARKHTEIAQSFGICTNTDAGICNFIFPVQYHAARTFQKGILLFEKT